MIPKPRPPIASKYHKLLFNIYFVSYTNWFTIILDPEIDEEDDGPENNIPNTPEAHPGVDDSFFPGDFPNHDHNGDGPPFSLGPRVGGESDDDGRGIITPNGVKPRRPSVSRDFPYAPGYNPNVVSIQNSHFLSHVRLLLFFLVY